MYYYTNYDAFLTGATFTSSYKNMRGIICFADTAGVTMTSTVLTIASSTLPSKWGKVLPGHGAVSLDTGRISDLKSNYADVGTAETATAITTPIAGRLL